MPEMRLQCIGCGVRYRTVPDITGAIWDYMSADNENLDFTFDEDEEPETSQHPDHQLMLCIIASLS